LALAAPATAASAPVTSGSALPADTPARASASFPRVFDRARQAADSALRAADAVGHAADSAGTEDDLRAAQRRFERRRRRRLPRTLSGADSCDRPLGRFCHWFEHPSPEPRPEPPAVAAERRELLDRLADGARRLPGSAWIAGQRVRYQIEAGRPDSALAAARACRAGGGWCRALAGWALHAAGREAEAERAFDRWLEALPAGERCEATDLSDLLEGDLRGRFRDLSCPDPRRDAFVRRFWWLADPLRLVEGNERRAEDLSRRTQDRILSSSASTFLASWGPDLSELLLRYGAPTWWERRPADPLRPGSRATVVGHDAGHARSFLPRRDVWMSSGSLETDVWDLSDDEPPTSYATAYADTFLALPHRTAIFRRGDSVLVAAPYAFPDSGTAPVEALLELGPGPEIEPARRVRYGAPRAGTLTLRAPARPALLSIELLDRSERAAARARYGLDPGLPDRGIPAISGLLAGPLRRGRPPTSGSAPGGGVSSPEDRAVAAARRLRLSGPAARAAPSVAAGDSVGLYWELYGLPPGRAAYEVQVALGDRDGHRNVRLVWWEEATGGSGFSAHELTLGIPDDAPAGTLAVEIRVDIPGWTPLEAVSPLEIGPPPPRSRAGPHGPQDGGAPHRGGGTLGGSPVY